MSRTAPWRSVWARVAAVAALAAWSADANATSCTQQCGGTSCTQSCSVNSISCSTSCYGGGCPGSITCEEYGPISDCRYTKTVECKTGGSGGPGDECIPGGCDPQRMPPRGKRASDDGSWAVIAYDDGCGGPTSCAVEVLAASDPEYAEQATADLRAGLFEQTRLTAKTHPERRPERRGRRVWFQVAPGTCLAASVELALDAERSFPPAPASHATLFRVVTDAAGFVVDAQSLFSEAPGEAAELGAFLLEHGRLATAEVGPFEAYVVLMVTTRGDLDHMLSGARRLAPPSQRAALVP
ncbi:MAG TPA: hypothetical protein VFS60_08580 [Thermoanaerobaculia bacterium]|nr:hypothetical protein [Thermoanaerobaculia bacterium]